MNEPSLNPPVDRKWDCISENVSCLEIKDLVVEILAHGIDDQVKKTVIKKEFPKEKPIKLVEELILNSNLDVLLKIVSDSTLNEVRDDLIDHMYHEDN